MKKTMKTLWLGLFAAISMAMSAASWAQTDAPKTITLIVPFASGGATDLVSRMMAKKVTERTGRVVVVENVAGAGGVLGAQRVARAAKDGSVLLMGTVSTHAINPLASATPPYDPIKDFSPVSLIATVPNVIVVNSNVKVQNLKDLLALAKAQDGKLSYGTSGVGTPPHLSGELLKTMAGIKMTHVPYRGGGPAMSDLVAGHIPVLMDVLTGAAAQIKAGGARAIAVTTPKRSAAFPDVPTVAESGLAGYETYTWNAIFAPAGVPANVIEILSKEFQQATAQPDIQDKLKELSASPVGSTSAVLAAHVKSELDKWSAVIKAMGGLKLD